MVTQLCIVYDRFFVFMAANDAEYQKRYPKDLRRDYIVSRELGKGACGTVFLGIKKSDNSFVRIFGVILLG